MSFLLLLLMIIIITTISILIIIIIMIIIDVCTGLSDYQPWIIYICIHTYIHTYIHIYIYILIERLLLPIYIYMRVRLGIVSRPRVLLVDPGGRAGPQFYGTSFL